MRPDAPQVTSRMCSTVVEVGQVPAMPRPYGGGWFAPDQVEIRYVHDGGGRWRAWEWIVSGWIVGRPGTRERMRRCVAGHAGDDPADMPSWVGEVIASCRPGGEG